ncbi:MAG TPA: alpha/beta hydrolase [Acidimicrobiales bacterium]|nr:alpha/beta hydrolase [Acidimicrobiales bacterium]
MLKSFAGGRIFGATWGSGAATVVALHGWQRTHGDFDGVFGPAEFTSTHSAIGIDLFGFGATPPPPEPWGADEYARHLLPLFDGADNLAERVTIVGHSFGGRVAVRLAALAPDRIDRLVLTGAPLLTREGRRATPALSYRLGRFLHRRGLVGDDRMEALRQRHGSPDYRAAQGVMRDVFVKELGERAARGADDLAAVSCPVDLVWGAEDTEVPVEVADRAQGMLRSSTLVTLPGIGHLTPTEAPDALRQAVLGGAVPRTGEVG